MSRLTFDKKLAKKMFGLFIPIFLEFLLINLLGSIDTLMLSNYNKLCVNAVGTAQSTLALLTTLIFISSNGVSILVGQLLGAKKKDDARHVLAQGIIFNFILGIILFLIFFFLAGPLLKLVNTNDDFFEFAEIYIKIYSIALPFQAITQVIGANFRAYGKPFYNTVVSIISNLINVLLNYLLIYGIGAIPEMGIMGAAIATACSLIFKTIAMIILEIRILKCPIFTKKINFNVLKGILKIGVPTALETISYTLFAFILVAALNTLTNEEIGSRAYVNLVINYTFLISNSLAITNSIIVSRFVGAHHYKKAKETTLKITGLAIIIMILLVGLINLIADPLFMAITNDQNYVDIIKKVLPLLFILEIGRATNIVIINAQKSSGDVLFPLILGIISMSIFMAGGSWVFTHVLNFGLFGIILAQGLDELFRGIFSFIRWLSNKWQNHSLIKEDTIIEDSVDEII